jgi:hypothetical protein
MITASKNDANSEEAVGVRGIVQGKGGAVCDARGQQNAATAGATKGAGPGGALGGTPTPG